MTSESVLVIVRSVGERTTDACIRLAQQQTSADQVVCVNAHPFSEALRRSLEMGLDAGQRWTLCLDADVLLGPAAIPNIIKEAEALPENTFLVEGRFADKLLGHFREGGIHLYRTSLLATALSEVEFRPDVVRPETHMKRQMAQLGHGFVFGDTLIGLHDYEQFYVDIFRKALVHNVKYSDALRGYALLHWNERARQDPDLRVALWAVQTADIFTHPVEIDRRIFPDTLATLLQMAGMEEKAPLPADAVSSDDVAQRLARFEVAPSYERWQQFNELYGRGILGRIRAVLYRHGHQTPSHLVGKALRQLGDRLDPAAE